MSSIIIECRNKDSDSVIQNGDWTTSLSENLTLTDGDQIVIKDSYIDTQQTSSSRILIPENLVIKFDYGFYIVNNTQTYFLNYGTQTPPAATDATLRNNVLCKDITVGTTTNQLLTDYQLTTSDKKTESKPAYITFTWSNDIPVVGGTYSRKIQIPSLRPNQIFRVQALTGELVNVSSKVGTVQNLSEFGLKVFKQTTIDVSGKRIQVPYTRTKEISIPKGNYTPDDLTALINIAVTSNDLVEGLFVTNNDALLQTARQIQGRFLDGTGDVETFFSLCDPEKSIFAPLQISAMINYKAGTGTDIFLGASLFEIEYDEGSKIFNIKYLHTPNYVNGIAVSYYQTAAGDPITTVNKTGGNFLTRLYAETESGDSFDFWDNLLGLGDDALVQFNFSPATHGSIDFLVPISDQLVDGVGITGQLSSVDGVVNKKTPLLLPAFTNGVFVVTTTANVTNGIAGGINALDAQDAFGYYLIEINSNFKNDFLTPDNNYRGIQQIVNRYYELNSYTAGEGGQLVYEHVGESVLLQSFHVRVLTSDKTLATNIGNDNTVHIELVRKPKPLLPASPPPPPPKEKK
tara:strand:+ start:3671 stop:5392 length:1722 start_codon:yes stop_codon:yes gene_type:complete